MKNEFATELETLADDLVEIEATELDLHEDLTGLFSICPRFGIS